jgi:predicted MFS family arabinose efflux permease
MKLYKWINLGIFAYAAALSQALWLNFGPLISEIEKKFSVSEDTAGLLLMVFPLIYVLISVPSGKYIDKRGYKPALLLGTLIMTVGAAIRIYESSFAMLLAAQIIIAISQPFIINSISKLVLEWFDKSQEAIATGLGTMGMFIGMAVGLMLTPYIYEKFGYIETMEIFAALSALSFIFCVVLLKPAPDSRQPNGHSSPVESRSIFSDLKIFLKDKNLVKIFALAFLGLGFFNGLTTWLEPILAPHGINSTQAGTIGGALIIGGIVGAIIIPAFSDIFKRRKPFVILGLVIAAATLLPLCSNGNFKTLLILSIVQGFFFLPAFSLILQMCSEQVGETHAATATGILMLLGNLGGVIVIILMQAVKSDTQGYAPSIYLMLAVLLISGTLTVLLKETHPSQALKIT